MKISKIQLLHPKIGFAEMVGIRIYTDNSIYGDGEVAGVSAGYNTFGMLRDLADKLIGRDPLDHEAIWDDLYKDSMFGQNGGQTFFSALGAIDIALWDIKGKFFNVPVYKLLGGKKREKLRTYASQLQTPWKPDPNRNYFEQFAVTPEDYAANAKYCVDLGYDAVKIDFGLIDEEGKFPRPSLRAGLYSPAALNLIERRVAAVRNAIGPNVDLIVENHAFTDAQSAIQIARTIEKYNIFFFEEPSVPTPKMTKFIADNINIPVAHGEHIIGRWEYAPYFENNSIQVIQPDFGNCGGITEVKKICDMAYIYDVGVQVHVFGSHLMTPAALHLEAVLPNFTIHEHHSNTQTADWCAMTVRTYDPMNGYFDIPELPGIGNEWSELVLHCEEQLTLDETGWHK